MKISNSPPLSATMRAALMIVMAATAPLALAQVSGSSKPEKSPGRIDPSAIGASQTPETVRPSQAAKGVAIIPNIFTRWSIVHFDEELPNGKRKALKLIASEVVAKKYRDKDRRVLYQTAGYRAYSEPHKLGGFDFNYKDARGGKLWNVTSDQRHSDAVEISRVVAQGIGKNKARVIVFEVFKDQQGKRMMRSTTYQDGAKSEARIQPAKIADVAHTHIQPIVPAIEKANLSSAVK